MSLLEIESLHVGLPSRFGVVQAIRGLSLTVEKGETLCLVGESGCGKSTTALAVMGLLPRNAVRQAKRMSFMGTDLIAASGSGLRALRGDRMAMVFQDAMTSLNPVYTIGNQLCEVYRRHRGGTHRQAEARAISLLDRVGISNPRERLGQFPHQLSGGLRQRVMIARALMCNPELLVADEPTSALDVTIQLQILGLLKDLQQEFGMGLLLITHDLGVVACIADRVAVMYAGQIVEAGQKEAIFSDPQHPYTQGLLRSAPALGAGRGQALQSIPGVVPSLVDKIEGCAFMGRCDRATAECGALQVPMIDSRSGTQARCIHLDLASRGATMAKAHDNACV